MRAIDTNVLVRLLTRDDPKQVAAAEMFVAPGAWISHLVLAEAVWVLSSVYELGAPEIQTAVEMLLQHKSLSVQEPEVVAAALVQMKRRPSLGFSDCLVLEIARKAGHTPLGSFDGALAKADGAERVGRRAAG